MTNVIKFTPPEPVDFEYIVPDGNIEGVKGKNVDMVMLTGDDGFHFNGSYISRSELIAFVLISGVWQDVQDN